VGDGHFDSCKLFEYICLLGASVLDPAREPMQWRIYGGIVRCPFWRDKTNICGCPRFQILEKWGKFVTFIERLIAKSISASVGQGGGLPKQAPWPSDRGLCPWSPLGTLPQTPVIDSRNALAMPVMSTLTSEPGYATVRR